MPQHPYRRVILKLSGDILRGKEAGGIDFKVVQRLANEIAEGKEEGIEIGAVVGGGNLFRGSDILELGYDRLTADNMGMLSTVINALAMQSALESLNVKTRVMSAVNISEFVEPFIQRRAVRHLEKGRVVIFAAGTGNPYFTTDTAAALRASQVDADVILKGTKVDGVYDRDPNKKDGAVKYDVLNYMDIIERRLEVMDMTAITFCRDFNMPIVVFNLLENDNFIRILRGEKIGTKVEALSK